MKFHWNEDNCIQLINLINCGVFGEDTAKGYINKYKNYIEEIKNSKGILLFSTDCGHIVYENDGVPIFGINTSDTNKEIKEYPTCTYLLRNFCDKFFITKQNAENWINKNKTNEVDKTN